MKRFLFIPLFVFVAMSFTACDDEVEVCVIDNYCDIDETYGFCPEDCDPICTNDGICDPDWEDGLCVDCMVDEGCNDDNICDEAYGETAANCGDCDYECTNDGICDEDWEDDLCDDCAVDECGDDYCDPGTESVWLCPEDCAVEACDNWASWVEVNACEDDLDVCTINDDLCLANMFDMAENDDEADVNFVEECAYQLGLDEGMCVDVEIDGINCAELLATEGYGEMTCVSK